MPTLLYGTASGALGVVASLDAATFATLKRIETAIASGRHLFSALRTFRIVNDGAFSGSWCWRFGVCSMASVPQCTQSTFCSDRLSFHLKHDFFVSRLLRVTVLSMAICCKCLLSLLPTSRSNNRFTSGVRCEQFPFRQSWRRNPNYLCNNSAHCSNNYLQQHYRN